MLLSIILKAYKEIDKFQVFKMLFPITKHLYILYINIFNIYIIYFIFIYIFIFTHDRISLFCYQARIWADTILLSGSLFLFINGL